MAEIVFFFVFCIPAMLGLAEILHTVKMLIITPKSQSNKAFVLVPENDDFEDQIINLAEQIKWNGKKYTERVIVLETLLSDENKVKCCALAKKFGFEICSKSDLTEIFF